MCLSTFDLNLCPYLSPDFARSLRRFDQPSINIIKPFLPYWRFPLKTIHTVHSFPSPSRSFGAQLLYRRPFQRFCPQTCAKTLRRLIDSHIYISFSPLDSGFRLLGKRCRHEDPLLYMRLVRVPAHHRFVVSNPRGSFHKDTDRIGFPCICFPRFGDELSNTARLLTRNVNE